MTIHYHGTPITPHATGINTLAGKFFCVSHARPDQVVIAHKIGQGVMLDNGAFSAWKRGHVVDWDAYYLWTEKWMSAFPTTWAVIPDEVGGGTQLQISLIKSWPHGHRGAPVWHLDEPINHLLYLADNWPRVCFGSTAEYANVGSLDWMRRVDEAFTALTHRHKFLPWVHMLRGMKLCEGPFPFASLDSTDVAQNHSKRGPARMMVSKWDAQQCPGGPYVPQPVQLLLEAV